MKLGDFELERLSFLENTLKDFSTDLYRHLHIEEWQEEYWDRKVGLMLERDMEHTQYQSDINRIATVFHHKYGEALQNIYNVLHKEYDPLFNTDATTDITSTDTYDTQNLTNENTEINRNGSAITNSSTNSTSDGSYEDDTNDDNTATLKNSGYNSNDLTITNQNVIDDDRHSEGSTSNTGTSNTTGISNSEDTTESDTNRISSDTGTVTHETLLRRYGNVGITTAQKMVTDEVLLRIQLNYLELLYKMLADFLLDKIWVI